MKIKAKIKNRRIKRLPRSPTFPESRRTITTKATNPFILLLAKPFQLQINNRVSLRAIVTVGFSMSWWESTDFHKLSASTASQETRRWVWIAGQLPGWTWKPWCQKVPVLLAGLGSVRPCQQPEFCLAVWLNLLMNPGWIHGISTPQHPLSARRLFPDHLYDDVFFTIKYCCKDNVYLLLVVRISWL